MISSIANLVYDLPHELPNDLRLRIFGNKDIIGKSKIWVGIELSAQSPFQKLNFGNSSQKTQKSRFQIFLVLFSLTGFLYFVSNILSRIKALDMDKIIVNIKHVSIWRCLYLSSNTQATTEAQFKKKLSTNET